MSLLSKSLRPRRICQQPPLVLLLLLRMLVHYPKPQTSLLVGHDATPKGVPTGTSTQVCSTQTPQASAAGVMRVLQLLHGFARVHLPSSDYTPWSWEQPSFNPSGSSFSPFSSTLESFSGLTGREVGHLCQQYEVRWDEHFFRRD